MKSTIAIDLGGTRIKIGIVEQGQINGSIMVDAFSDKGLLPRLKVIEENIDTLLNDWSHSKKNVAGIAISIPGIVDTQKMKLLSVNKKFNDAVDFDFLTWARNRWNLPLVIENDARAALVGEWQCGAGKGVDNLIMMTLGTGVGGAALMEGQLVKGKHFQAGCLAGHFTVNYHGTICTCGNRGCVESEASSWRLPELARNNPRFSTSKLSTSQVIDYHEVFHHASEGDILASELITGSLDAWSAGVINLIHAYDPELVIIGGGIMKSRELILPHIQQKVDLHAWTPWGKVKVVCAENPDWAALQGMEYLLGLQTKKNNA